MPQPWLTFYVQTPTTIKLKLIFFQQGWYHWDWSITVSLLR